MNISMNISVETPFSMRVKSSTTSKSGPTKDERTELRKLKPTPETVSCCGNCHLIGNGWRKKFIIHSWWSTSFQVLWYWRLRCKGCGKTHNLFFDLCVPGFYYAYNIIFAVVAAGLTKSEFLEKHPSLRTQKRWLSRFRDGWAQAQAQARRKSLLKVPLEEWLPTAEKISTLFQWCWHQGVNIFSPQNHHQERFVGTHQLRLLMALSP